MGFVEPLALLFAGLYGVLILFYLWERWRRRVTVPSLLLWEAVREDTIRARRFRPDLLFVLQLLLLTCLIVGLARPYVQGEGSALAGGRHIFVLDTSASMQTRESRSTRFEQARDQALKVLNGLHADDEVMLIAAAHAPQVLVGFTWDHQAIAQALAHAEPTDAGADISLALAFTENARQRSDLPTAVDVFTDMPRSQLPLAVREQATVYQVGESDDNLAIEALQIFQGRFQDFSRARAYVLVHNFAHREGHGFLTVQLEDQVVHRSGFTIPPRDAKGFVIHDFPGSGRVVAHLDVNDALAADNTAWGWIRPLTPVRVLLVSPASPLTEELRELTAATPALQLAVVEPGRFTAEDAAHADLVIFHRVVPNEMPPVNALFIYPPKDNRLFPVAADATDIEVLDWNTHHAALQSLRPLAALPLQRARVSDPPSWSQVLLWSRTLEREFPLAWAGDHGGHRVACITFDLEAERLLSSDNVNFFLFFMNLLGWLTPESRAAVVVNTGDVQSIDAPLPLPVQVLDPRGRRAALPADQMTIEPLFAGVYQLSFDSTRRTLLANFFDPVESDIGRGSREPLAVAAVRPPTVRSQENLPGSEYGRWLYYAAAALFLIEWLVARRPDV